MKLGLLIAASAFLLGAGQAWEWHLPPGIAPPPVPADNPMRAAKVELGRRLFYDADLSRDGTMACATCHEQRHGFADGNATHGGVGGAAGRRNVPGLANVAWFSPLTSADAGQRTLEAQAGVPVMGTHPVEMGMAGAAAAIVTRLSHDDCYRTIFAQAFPESGGRIDFANVSRALASFERTLVSYGSAYDRHALGPDARGGERTFRRACAQCHAGARFTDLRFHRMGPIDRAAPDQGLVETSGREADRGLFRTPSLRNVAMSGPWWHDGSATTLDTAIARHKLALPPQSAPGLIAFLRALDDRTFLTDPAFGLPATACGRTL
ncbi:cytochrome-c peroxidase [Novosphingobium sp.]|uniref:cytochrome-c peroxidase n=1 Tax=Novosphingobium sp. TaxID=1874826 RepID=UPI003B52C57F